MAEPTEEPSAREEVSRPHRNAPPEVGPSLGTGWWGGFRSRRLQNFAACLAAPAARFTPRSLAGSCHLVDRGTRSWSAGAAAAGVR